MYQLSWIACSVALLWVAPAGAIFGQCSNQAFIRKFNEAAYMGTWYEFGRSAVISQIFTPCKQDVYTLGSDGYINVVSSHKNSNEHLGKLRKSVPGASDSAYVISYSDDYFEGKEEETIHPNYVVLDTDYTSYSIIWSCFNSFIFKFEGVEILTRERKPGDELIEQIRTIIDKRDFLWFFIGRTNQNC